MSPQVSWLFFKAVRAGLAVKRPYLDPYGSIRRGGGKTANRPRPEGCIENGPARGNVSACRRVGVCKASLTPSRPPDHCSLAVSRSSLTSPDADTPTRFTIEASQMLHEPECAESRAILGCLTISPSSGSQLATTHRTDHHRYAEILVAVGSDADANQHIFR